ncbi:MAG: TatD family hydrolase [Phycisphaerae bacterium]
MTSREPTLIDSHVHLQDPAFADDLEQVLSRASQARIEKMIINGTKETDWLRAARIGSLPGCRCCFGLHPWFVPDRSDMWETNLNRVLDAYPAVGIGEIGLDRWIEPRDESAQEEVFRRQLAIARERDLPVMVHCLRAWGWLMDVLRGEDPLERGMLIHAYGGPAEMLEEFADMGAYFSFAGNVLEPKRKKAREALAAVPAERLLIETDAPDMPPPERFGPHNRPREDEDAARNEPANLSAIAEGIAGIRDENTDELAERTTQNAREFFGARLD